MTLLFLSSDLMLVSSFITGDEIVGIHNLQQFLSPQFEIKDLGFLSYFLGLEVSSHSNSYYLSQVKYASTLLSRVGLTNWNFVDSPLKTNIKLHATDELPSNATLYWQLVESLIYLTIT